MDEKSVGLAGLGSLGQEIVCGLQAGIPGLKLAAVANLNPSRAQAILSRWSEPPKRVSLAELAKADIVIEALPAEFFDDVAIPAIESGKIFMPCSVGALLTRLSLIEKAKETGSRIVVPTGAIAGLDAVRAIARGPVESVTLESRKPPQGFAVNPYLESRGINVHVITEPQLIFEGSAAEATRHFPANANVAAALALAGIGPERTRVQIWADPTVQQNVHSIRVEAGSARLTVCVENVPNETNPRTSKLAALSVLACLSGLVGPLRVGS